MSSVLLLLAMHPEHQEHLFEEVKALMPDPDSDLTAEHLSKLNFTGRCIMEALRLLPTVPFIARSPVAPIMLSNGVTIPSGVPIAIAIRQIQTRCEYWGHDAKQFNPNRYLRPDCQRANNTPGSFLGFSYGLRNCIGMPHLFRSHSLRRFSAVFSARFSQTIWFRYHYWWNCFDFALSKHIFCSSSTLLNVSDSCFRLSLCYGNNENGDCTYNTELSPDNAVAIRWVEIETEHYISPAQQASHSNPWEDMRRILGTKTHFCCSSNGPHGMLIQSREQKTCVYLNKFNETRHFEAAPKTTYSIYSVYRCIINIDMKFSGLNYKWSKQELELWAIEFESNHSMLERR